MGEPTMMMPRSPEAVQQRVDALLQKFREMPIIVDVLKQLKTELPKHLRYHTPPHTDDVMHEAILFAVEDEQLPDALSERELELLAIASAYHDVGFVVQDKRNEEIGASMAEGAMRNAGGYTDDEIRLVKEAIEDTQLKFENNTPSQKPARNRIGKYLLDGDVSNLGRSDFRRNADLLIEEDGKVVPREFLERSARMLAGHQWQTSAAQRLRSEGLRLNLKNLQTELSATEEPETSKAA